MGKPSKFLYTWELRRTPATRVLERQDLHTPRFSEDPVIHVITHAGEVYTTDAREPDISGTRSDFRLNGYQNGCAFKFFADRVRRLRRD